MALTIWANVIILVGVVLAVAAIIALMSAQKNYDPRAKSISEALLIVAVVAIIGGILLWAVVRPKRK